MNLKCQHVIRKHCWSPEEKLSVLSMDWWIGAPYFKHDLISLVWTEVWTEWSILGRYRQAAMHAHFKAHFNKTLASVFSSTFYFASSFAMTHLDQTHLSLTRPKSWSCTDVLSIPVVVHTSQTQKQRLGLGLHFIFIGCLEMSSLHSCSET